ncbi:MAG: dioxygenase [Rickettsiaceae bacterium]|nr:dioxygenase [Rickettsiaceae bacterium]
MNLKKVVNLFTILFCILYYQVILAASCTPNETASNDYEPDEFITSNNLLNQAGQTPLFCGERIIIYGKLVDTSCKPISDAKIYLWQVDCTGKYPYKPLRNIADPSLINISNDGHSFTGNGIATTNNLGEFVFVTIYPNKVHDMQPHLNLRAEKVNRDSLQIIIPLKKHRLYNPETTIKNDSILNLIRDYSAKVYGFQVVMPN